MISGVWFFLILDLRVAVGLGKVYKGLIDMPDTAAQYKYLTIAGAANLLGVSVSTLRNWDRAGKFQPRRHPINGYRIYDRAEILHLKQQIEGIKNEGPNTL